MYLRSCDNGKISPQSMCDMEIFTSKARDGETRLQVHFSKDATSYMNSSIQALAAAAFGPGRSAQKVISSALDFLMNAYALKMSTYVYYHTVGSVTPWSYGYLCSKSKSFDPSP